MLGADDNVKFVVMVHVMDLNVLNLAVRFNCSDVMLSPTGSSGVTQVLVPPHLRAIVITNGGHDVIVTIAVEVGDYNPITKVVDVLSYDDLCPAGITIPNQLAIAHLPAVGPPRMNNYIVISVTVYIADGCPAHGIRVDDLIFKVKSSATFYVEGIYIGGIISIVDSRVVTTDCHQSKDKNP